MEGTAQATAQANLNAAMLAVPQYDCASRTDLGSLATLGQPFDRQKNSNLLRRER